MFRPNEIVTNNREQYIILKQFSGQDSTFTCFMVCFLYSSKHGECIGCGRLKLNNCMCLNLSSDFITFKKYKKPLMLKVVDFIKRLIYAYKNK